jgi:hypothetical protein
MTMRGEKVYECDFDVTGVTDFGIALEAILSGKEKIPPQGARIDVAYAGTIKGRVTGSIRGVDYQVIRADGRLPGYKGDYRNYRRVPDCPFCLRRWDAPHRRADGRPI